MLTRSNYYHVRENTRAIHPILSVFATKFCEKNLFFCKNSMIFELPRAFAPVLHTFSRKQIFFQNLMLSKYFHKNSPFVPRVTFFLRIKGKVNFWYFYFAKIFADFCNQIFAKMQKRFLVKYLRTFSFPSFICKY